MTPNMAPGHPYRSKRFSDFTFMSIGQQSAYFTRVRFCMMVRQPGGYSSRVKCPWEQLQATLTKKKRRVMQSAVTQIGTLVNMQPIVIDGLVSYESESQVCYHRMAVGANCYGRMSFPQEQNFFLGPTRKNASKRSLGFVAAHLPSNYTVCSIIAFSVFRGPICPKRVPVRSSL